MSCSVPDHEHTTNAATTTGPDRAGAGSLVPRQRTLPRRGLLASAALAGLGAAGVSAFVGPAGDRADAGTVTARTGRRSAAPEPEASGAGTTLDRRSVPKGEGTYRRLTGGPGWPRVVREDLAPAQGGRAERRRVLSSFVQLTDLHVVDVQHPLRFEYLRSDVAKAWRPQEALSVPGTVSLVERVNALRAGPATGEPLAFAMTTGDNTDNNSRAELEWFLTVMSGGRIVPNTGDPRRYEGVQDSGERQYWHPGDDLRDADKAVGYPRMPGFLEAAIREVASPGLDIPWYSTVGNHDVLPGGCYGHGESFLTETAVGDRKLYTLPARESVAMRERIKEGTDPLGRILDDLLRSHSRRMREVTPDPHRAPFTRAEYAHAHRNPRFTGAGPVGHGYTADAVAEDRLYYTFRMADDVLGVSLDTTRPDGHYVGAVSPAQLRWLEQQLTAHPDDYVVLFSHHPSVSTPDGGPELLDLLGRHPNVVAWINGHSHRNRITAHEGGFWEVCTASHVDFPQLARTLEITDNRDGTLSLFATLIESAAPWESDHTDLSQTGLASLYRELAFNAPGRGTGLSGTPGDRNVELLLPKPKPKPGRR